MDQFSVGGVLSRSFTIWSRNFVAFFLISVVVYIPAIIASWLSVTGKIGFSPMTAGLLVGGLWIIFGMVATGAITFGVFEELRGRRVSIGTALSRGLSRVPSVFGVGFLIFLILFGLGIVMVVVGGITGAIFGMISPIFGAILVFVIIATPLLAMYCRFWVAVPAAVVEEAGSTEALRRSALLTDGVRKSIFGIVLLLFGLTFGASWLLGKVITDSPMLFLIVNSLVSLAIGALSSTASAVAYHDLRVSKEGVGTEELARVFD